MCSLSSTFVGVSSFFFSNTFNKLFFCDRTDVFTFYELWLFRLPLCLIVSVLIKLFYMLICFLWVEINFYTHIF